MFRQPVVEVDESPKKSPKYKKVGKTTKAIGGTTLVADQFDIFLRTGGGLGDSHIFGPSAISPGGMATLYAYVKSLPGK